MSVAVFISKHFIGKELCISLGGQAETITYADSWAYNLEFFRGIIKQADDGVVEIEIKGHGSIYINEDDISCFWKPGIDYRKAISTSITRKVT